MAYAPYEAMIFSLYISLYFSFYSVWDLDIYLRSVVQGQLVSLFIFISVFTDLYMLVLHDLDLFQGKGA